MHRSSTPFICTVHLLPFIWLRSFGAAHLLPFIYTVHRHRLSPLFTFRSSASFTFYSSLLLSRLLFISNKVFHPLQRLERAFNELMDKWIGSSFSLKTFQPKPTRVTIATAEPMLSRSTIIAILQPQVTVTFLSLTCSPWRPS